MSDNCTYGSDITNWSWSDYIYSVVTVQKEELDNYICGMQEMWTQNSNEEDQMLSLVPLT